MECKFIKKKEGKEQKIELIDTLWNVNTYSLFSIIEFF